MFSEDCCNRCGAYKHPPLEEGNHANPDDDEEQVDEFGRSINKRKETKVIPEWPPKFESDGSSFVFDSRSGMFYNAESDFFYDPNSKMYFSNKKQAYYRHDETSDPPFQIAHLAKGQDTMNPTAEPALAPQKKPGTKVEPKGSISIKLKTKSLKSRKPKTLEKKQDATSSSSVNTKVQKQHAVDMDKWSDRQVEKSVEERTIQRTAKGEPMCPLCRRKFPTVEKLLYHERVSQLHKDNLAKQAQTKKTAPVPGNDKGYVDRAKQRRDMYGPETTPVAVPLPTSLPTSGSTEEITASTPQDNLNETNVGNKLLQKMGWKEGKSIGRTRGNEESSLSNSNLTKDWERIEAIAAANGGSRRPVGNRNEGVGSRR